MIPFVNIQAQRNAYRQELEEAEKSVLDSGIYIGGKEIAQLEAELSSFTGAKNVITCASGTDAITIALVALDVQPGDEVIIPDFTFIAPAECTARLNATPKFADIDPRTLQISAKSVESLIGPRTKGIIAVNLFGQCAPYKELREIANRHGLWILEDSAQAFGATQNSKQACTFGDISITSFYPSKPLGCYGDGGALFTDNIKLAEKIRMIANHGSSERYLHQVIGMNSRLDALQAAVLRVKLRHLENELEMRRKNASCYNKYFEAFEGIMPQAIAEGNTSTYAQYTLLVENREAFIDKLKNAEIPYCIHYPMPLHKQPCFKKDNDQEAVSCIKAESINRAEAASKKAISLPMCAFTDVNAIISKLQNEFKE